MWTTLWHKLKQRERRRTWICERMLGLTQHVAIRVLTSSIICDVTGDTKVDYEVLRRCVFAWVQSSKDNTSRSMMELTSNTLELLCQNG